MSCPDCRSTNAVPKAEAWDALTTTPPKVAAELIQLRKVGEAAEELLTYGVGPCLPSEEVSIYVSEKLLLALYEAAGMTPTHTRNGIT